MSAHDWQGDVTDGGQGGQDRDIYAVPFIRMTLIHNTRSPIDNLALALAQAKGLSQRHAGMAEKAGSFAAFSQCSISLPDHRDLSMRGV